MNRFKTVLLMAAMTALFLVVGFSIGGQSGMLIALTFAAATNLFAWWKSDKLALRLHKAQLINAGDAPQIFEMVAQLARNAELPMPKIYLIEGAQPNAFATGRDPENAAVAITTGIVETLSTDELAGVIAHELAHIKNRDTLIMTLSATFAGTISMLSQFSLFFGGGRDRPLGRIGTIAMAILAPLAAMIIQMTISRTREYAADRLGAQICGNPLWLASALVKISNAHKTMTSAQRFPASAHMFIVNPLSGGTMDSLFSTHPNMENRIAALKALAKEMGQRSAFPLPQPPAKPQPASRKPRTAPDQRRENPWQ